MLIWIYILKGKCIWLNRGEMFVYFDCLYCFMFIIMKMEYVLNLEYEKYKISCKLLICLKMRVKKNEMYYTLN